MARGVVGRASDTGEVRRGPVGTDDGVEVIIAVQILVVEQQTAEVLVVLGIAVDAATVLLRQGERSARRIHSPIGGRMFADELPQSLRALSSFANESGLTSGLTTRPACLYRPLPPSLSADFAWHAPGLGQWLGRPM